MSNLKLALLSTICLLPLLTLSASPALAAKAGVTAAVNPQALGTPSGGGVRTIVLGEDVLTNEKIDTTGGGLVQILLADGTTFTVGPNSSLTIDKFVYDPDANTAQVTASLAKGVFRFIGGRTSKTDGGVTINTPVGTVGIRGAVADISLTPNGQTLKAQIDLLFGKEVTLSGPGGLIDRIYKAGYSIIIGNDGHAQLVKTPPGSANTIQTALAGKPGTHGGAGDGPSDGQVADSGVPGSNSDQGLPPGYAPPDLEAIELATIDFFDTHDDAKEILDAGDNELPPGRNQIYTAGTVIFYQNDEGYYDPLQPTYLNLNSNKVAKNYGDFDASGVLLGGHWSALTRDDLVDLGALEPGEGASEDGFLQSLDVSFGNAGDGATIKNWGETPVAGANVTTDITSSANANCVCAFLSWGDWTTTLDLDGGDKQVVATGPWVAGRPATDNQFTNYRDAHTSEVATYDGSAVGTVFNAGDTYTAEGDMRLEYHFGPRTGTMAITHFDVNSEAETEHNFTMQVAGSATSPQFSGYQLDPNNNFLSSGYFVSGTFVTDGTSPTAGVMGNFGVVESNDYAVVGVFGGSKDTPH